MLLRSTESAIEVDGRPLAVSAAYSGRVAVAFKVGSSFTRPTKGSEDDRYVNLAVSIYECESTGGSEWMLEDTVSRSKCHLRLSYSHAPQATSESVTIECTASLTPNGDLV